MPRNLFSAIKTHQGILLLLFLASLLFLTNIGSYGQLLRAETNFSMGARMLVETQEFLLPHAPHERPLNKTPLQNWLIGISYMIFGFSHGASRVPSALCGLGVLVLVYILGVRLRDQRIGLAASAMLSTSYIFWSFSRLCMPDMLLTLCVTAALVCWMLVLTGRTEHPQLLAIIGSGAVGVGFLAKGPIALVLALLPLCLEIIVTRDLSILKRLKPIQGSAVFLVIAAPYFLLVYAFHGIEPLHNFFIGENLSRFTGKNYNTSNMMFVYESSALLANFAPWTPLIIVAFGSLVHWRKLDSTTKHQLRFILLWIISPIIFFSLSNFKLDYYFLPVMPGWP
ncbi:MAG: glycosyltransferase family 39 protein [Nitrospirae bacterium]|nr:glycosyltransferase family 39 protein [Nitrospirota bacterium]MDA1303997.1 glycosyltransferase family 39 protein [Nitrospirota bacterium]